jgi:hypothetical protein
MYTDDIYPVHGTLEVRGTRARLAIGRSFGAFIDANDVEHLATLLQSAVDTMRHNGSCGDCGGKGFSMLNNDRVDCERCFAQGFIVRGELAVSQAVATK